MRQVYIQLSTNFIHLLKINSMLNLCGKNPRRVFSKFFCEPQFPKDAKIVKTTFHSSYDIYDIYIESKTYPDVEMPSELMLICHRDNIWKEREVVQFT